MSNAVVQDFATILVVGSAIGWALRELLKLPLLVGYIIAGIIIKLPYPYTPNLVNPGDIKNISEIGVLLIMFTVGFHFGFTKIKQMKISWLITSIGECSLMWLAGYLISRWFGLSDIASLFVGSAVIASSSALIFKMLEDLKLDNLRFASRLTAGLILEDAYVVFVIIALSTSIQGKSDVYHFSIPELLPLFIVGVMLWWIIGTVLLPRVIRFLSRGGSNEVLVSICVGMALAGAFISVKLHTSAALGAFLVGSVLSECREIKKIEKIVTPIKDIFTLVFFASVGMLFSPAILLSEYHIIIVFVILSLFGKLIFNMGLNLVTGNNLKDSFRVSGMMGQSGEMALIMVQLALQFGVITTKWYSIIIASTIITMFLTPFVMKLFFALADESETLLPKKAQAVLVVYSNFLSSFSFANTMSPMYKKLSILNKVKSLLGFLHGEFWKSYHKMTSANYTPTLARLAPWDEYLVTILIDPVSVVVGKNILELNLREEFSVNIVAIERESRTIVLPSPTTTIFGGDTLLVYGSESNITRLSHYFSRELSHVGPDLDECSLMNLYLGDNHPFVGQTMADLKIRVVYSCIVLAVYREDTKIKNPDASFEFQADDEMFVFGSKDSLKKIERLSLESNGQKTQGGKKHEGGGDES